MRVAFPPAGGATNVSISDLGPAARGAADCESMPHVHDEHQLDREPGAQRAQGTPERHLAAATSQPSSTGATAAVPHVHP